MSELNCETCAYSRSDGISGSVCVCADACSNFNRWEPRVNAERMTATEVLARQDPTEAPETLNTQVGGNHYKDLNIQPVEYIHANGIGFCEGSVIKYVTRWRVKGGVDDLKKARHFLDLLIELERMK